MKQSLIKLKLITTVCALLLMFFQSDSYPPLVPEGERIDQIQELVRNINRQGFIMSIDFSPDGKILATGSEDGTVRLWNVNRTIPDRQTRGSIPGDTNTMLPKGYGKILRTFISGRQGNWLCIDAENRVWRGDDGSLLLQKDEKGSMTPKMPPAPQPGKKGKLTLLYKPPALETYEGEASKFNLICKNTGKGRIYWINVIHDKDKDME